MIHSKHIAVQAAIQKSLSEDCNFRYCNTAVSVLKIDIAGIANVKCYYKDHNGTENQIEASDFEKAEYGFYSCYAMIEMPDSNGGSVTQEYVLENIFFEVVGHRVNDGKDFFDIRHISPVCFSLR